MHKVIHEQPTAIGETLKSYIDLDKKTLNINSELLNKRISRITMVACGTSSYACTCRYPGAGRCCKHVHGACKQMHVRVRRVHGTWYTVRCNTLNMVQYSTWCSAVWEVLKKTMEHHFQCWVCCCRTCHQALYEYSAHH